MIKYVFFALACVPAACYAQPIGICFEERQEGCAVMGQGYGPPCNQSDCDPVFLDRCSKPTGLTVINNNVYWDVWHASGAGSTIVVPLGEGLKCGDIYDCSCDPDIGDKCLADPGSQPFKPQEFRIGAINCG